MAKVDTSQLVNFQNGQQVGETELDQNFEVLRVAINDTDTRVDNTYTREEVNYLISSAVATKLVEMGAVFPVNPVDGQEFFYTVDRKLYIYENGGWSKVDGDVLAISTQPSSPTTGLIWFRMNSGNSSADILVNLGTAQSPYFQLVNAGGARFNIIQDTRSENKLPNQYAQGVHYEFKTGSAVGLSGVGFALVITHKPWTDHTGGKVHQVAYADDGGVYRRISSADHTSWGTWAKISDVNGTTWGIRRSVNISGTDLNNLVDSGWYSGNNLINAPNGSSQFFFVMHIAHATTLPYAVQIAFEFYNDSEVYMRRNNNGTWGNWRKMWNDSNAFPHGALRHAFLFGGNDGDVTISSNTTVPRRVMMYNNLTINSGVTLTGLPGLTVIGVKGTLTLNGGISANGKGAAGGAGTGGGGKGGNGGGVLVVFANKIVGTGWIGADGDWGANGTNPTSPTGNVSGSNGICFGISVPGGSSSSGGAGNASVKSKLDDFAYGLISDFLPNEFAIIGGGGGCSGRADTVADSVAAYGASGGAGLGGSSGGNKGGSTGEGSFTGSSAGAGGGGGAVFLFSPNAIPAITVSAKGGNGGTPFGQAEASGGGGGGYVAIFAPSSSATVNVAGGAAGSPGSPITATAQPGGAGVYQFFKI